MEGASHAPCRECPCGTKINAHTKISMPPGLKGEGLCRVESLLSPITVALHPARTSLLFLCHTLCTAFELQLRCVTQHTVKCTCTHLSHWYQWCVLYAVPSHLGWWGPGSGGLGVQPLCRLVGRVHGCTYFAFATACAVRGNAHDSPRSRRTLKLNMYDRQVRLFEGFGGHMCVPVYV